LSFDEKGRTPVKQYTGAKWTNDKYYYAPYTQKVKGIFDIFAAQNIHTGKRHHKFYDWKNSYIVIDSQTGFSTRYILITTSTLSWMVGVHTG